MPKYLIERNVRGAHTMSARELHEGANRSCDVLDALGSDIVWHESYVTKDRITCVYTAPDEALVREHARLSGFPADDIREVASMMSPRTAEPRMRAGAATR